MIPAEAATPPREEAKRRAAPWGVGREREEEGRGKASEEDRRSELDAIAGETEATIAKNRWRGKLTANSYGLGRCD